MEAQQGIFSVKLQELEREYDRLQSCIRLYQSESPERIRAALDQLVDECRAQDRCLEQNLRCGRLPSAAALSGLQLEYSRRSRELYRTMLEQDLKGCTPTADEDRAEALTLYAEYAIDFATCTMRHALIAALQAAEIQQMTEEKYKERYGKSYE